ncbi:MAG: hypothetical protein QXD03_02525 [Candidatus Anstonellales archaeon]
MFNRVKRLVVSVLILMVVFNGIVYGAVSDKYGFINSKEALGSPILNPDFNIEDWNKWEMVVWGIYLSNFAIPLVDDYDSAFNANANTGSKGAGYKALVFGSGSDSGNSKLIKSLLEYAIKQQKLGALTPIHVTYSKIERGKIVKGSPNYREATLKDLFIANSEKGGETWVELQDTVGADVSTSRLVAVDYDRVYMDIFTEIGKSSKYVSIATIEKGNLPTFGVKYGSGYETIFDYTDGWDIQLLTAFMSKILCSEYGKKYKSALNDIVKNSDKYKLYLDVFGNIVINYNGARKIVIPASVNQHLTETPKINLLNSFIFNGYNQGLTSDELVLRGQQSVSGWFGYDTLFGLVNTTDVRAGGLPAFGSHLVGMDKGCIIVYYDLDTIIQDAYFNGGSLSVGIKTVGDEKFNGGKVNKVHYGKAVKELFDLDINNELGNKYLFKIEASNVGKMDFSIFDDKEVKKIIYTSINASGQIANLVAKTKGVKVLSYIVTPQGNVSLFDEPVIIPVQMDNGKTNGRVNNAGVGRSFMNFLYSAYRGKVSTLVGDITPDYVKNLIISSSFETMSDFKKNILGLNNKTISPLLAGFMVYRNDLFSIDGSVDYRKLTMLEISDGFFDNVFDNLKGLKYKGKKVVEGHYVNSGTSDYFPGRLVKAYPISKVMKAVGNVLGLKEGTEYNVYSSYIYLTYLKWYGLKIDRLTGQVTSELNTRIFSNSSEVLNFDIQQSDDYMSEEDKKKEVLHYTRLLLHPQDGSDYRQEILDNYFTNFIYKNYTKLVHGNANEYYSNVNNLATRSGGGFLNIQNYSDNFMTSWFIGEYAKVVVFLIGLSCLLIIVIGVLKGKGVSWYILSLVAVINILILVPSIADVVPNVCNSYVQSMFKDKMSYWAISESIANAVIEAKGDRDNIQAFQGLDDKEKDEAGKLIKSLNVLFVDRALGIKNDISRKVTQTQIGNYAEIQKFQSTRWLLPLIMRQFTGRGYDYVYVPLGDLYDDMSNLYWMYNPEDAKYVNTINSRQEVQSDNKADIYSPIQDKIPLNDRKNYFAEYKNTTANGKDVEIPYKAPSYYRGIPVDDLVHTYSYLLRYDMNVIDGSDVFSGGYTTEAIDNYIKKAIDNNLKAKVENVAILLEKIAGTYNRFDRSTMKQPFGYLFFTENNCHYFYQSIKDNFDSDMSLGQLVGLIQGQYVKKEDGSEVRTSIAHAGESGYIRDVLDLEELFTNVVPYLYKMQLIAGGLDNKSGLLGNSKIEEYTLYKNNAKAWLFRSNWVTKMMNNPQYNRKAIIRDSKGNRIEVENQMLPSCYPADRPMVFSEAQMKAYGLSEADLSLVELKCVKVNREVARRWTLLLNYVNIKGINKEVLLRQMATEAFIVFNSEFSPSGILNNRFSLYPSTIDLRYVSFDSIVRLILLNVTKDYGYVYGDAIKNLINNSEIFTASLLLLSAFTCSYVIPFLRNVVLGLIFYLGFISIIYGIVVEKERKLRSTSSIGFILCNLLFLVLTLVYYAIFDLIMSITTDNSVLVLQYSEVKAGNPVWAFMIMLGASIAYVVFLFKMIDFVFRNYRDMGYTVFASVANSISEVVSSGLSSIIDGVSNRTSESASGVIGKASKVDVESDINVHAREEGGSLDELSDYDIEYKSRDYSDSDSIEIDKEIERGKNLD